MRHLRILACMLLLASVAMGQTRTLTGVLKDSKTGEGIPSATIKVKGRAMQATSNATGAFTLNIPQGQVELEITSVGYGSKVVTVDPNETSLLISLEQTGEQLGEVVVTALGISKESKKIGYAVTQVNGDLLNKAKETNLAYSLEGRVAGLNISGTSGGPGSSARILLRGMASFSAGSPLFVINGVPMDNTQRGSTSEWGGADVGDGIGNLNPDDIESMTVLKGASASALYGARAANGVILITTKTGKKGGLAVDYSVNYTLDKAVDNTDWQYVYGQGVNGARPANITDAVNSGMYSWGAKMDGASTIQFDGKNYPYSPVKDNPEKFYRTAPTFINTVAVSGGNENGSFRLSLSNMDNQSILRNSGITRKTINLNAIQKVSDHLTISVTANYIDDNSRNRPFLSDAPMNANNINFLAANVDQVALQPGYLANTPNGDEIHFNDDIFVTNPWFVVNRFVNNIGRKRLISSITARYDITKHLFAQARIGYDKMNDRAFTVTPTGTAYSSGGLGKLDNLGTSETIEFNADGLIGYETNITSDLSTSISVGANMRKNRFESIGVNGSPFVLPFFYSPFNVGSYGRSYAFNEKRANSAYYTADFTYKGYLTLSTTGRYDAFSTLPADNNNVFTPSVSGSFIFSQLLNIPSLNYGKLRASYAQTSGEPTDPYITSQYYSVGSTVGGITTGSFSGSLPNLFLKPYTLSEIEVGTELKFFNNRLGFDIAYFARKTRNEIINGALSPATGYTSQYIGTGSTQNRGLEVLITGSPLTSNRALQWNVTFNFTTVNNKILEINGTGDANETRTLGTYRPRNANTALVKGLPGPQIIANDYVRDASGRIVVDGTGIPKKGPLTPMGSVLPKYYGGLNNEFSYKSFNLSFLLDYKYGNKVLSATSYYGIFRGLDKMTLAGRETGVVADGVLEDGTKNTINVPAQNYYQNLARSISALNVLDGSFIKLRQITLGYSLPSDMFGKLPFQAVTVSFVARNLLTLMKHTDNIDPEAGFSSLINYAGIEGNGLPATRTYGINVNIKFKK